MWRRALFLLLIMFFAATVEAANRPARIWSGGAQTNIEWSFVTREDRDGNPNTRVFLNVGRRRFFILRDVAQFHVLERTDYKEHGIPSTALAACTAWWAGSGEVMYVIRKGRQLIVYIQYLEEQTETEGYKRLKTIPLR